MRSSSASTISGTLRSPLASRASSRSNASWREIVTAVARRSATSTAAMLAAATTTTVTVHAASHMPMTPLSTTAAMHATAIAMASPLPPKSPTASATTASALPSAARPPSTSSAAAMAAVPASPIASHRVQAVGASAERIQRRATPCGCAGCRGNGVWRIRRQPYVGGGTG